MKLNFQIIPTYCIRTFDIFDTSVYDVDPPVLDTPLLEVTIPNGFDKANIVFVPNEHNILDSTVLGITEDGQDPLPDGVYTFKYSSIPIHLNFVEKSILRIDNLQEKFDEAFMRLDMMMCDQTLRRQEKLELNTIYFLIQGAISSANYCSFDQANALYLKAYKLLTRFRAKSICCNGTSITNIIY